MRRTVCAVVLLLSSVTGFSPVPAGSGSPQASLRHSVTVAPHGKAPTVARNPQPVAALSASSVTSAVGSSVGAIASFVAARARIQGALLAVAALFIARYGKQLIGLFKTKPQPAEVEAVVDLSFKPIAELAKATIGATAEAVSAAATEFGVIEGSTAATAKAPAATASVAATVATGNFFERRRDEKAASEVADANAKLEALEAAMSAKLKVQAEEIAALTEIEAAVTRKNVALEAKVSALEEELAAATTDPLGGFKDIASRIQARAEGLMDKQ